MTIERLRYDSSLADLRRRQRLMHDSSGSWAKIGHRLDAYKEGAYQNREGSLTQDPWVQDGEWHSIRSSSFREEPRYCRISRRWAKDPKAKSDEVGFRVCLEVDSQ